MRCTAVITFVAHALHADEAQKSPPQWKAGAASIVITPERPLRMAGYGGRTDPADGTVQDLFANFLLRSKTSRDSASRSLRSTATVISIAKTSTFLIWLMNSTPSEVSIYCRTKKTNCRRGSALKNSPRSTMRTTSRIRTGGPNGRTVRKSYVRSLLNRGPHGLLGQRCRVFAAPGRTRRPLTLNKLTRSERRFDGSLLRWKLATNT